MNEELLTIREAWNLQAEWWNAATVDGDSGKVTAQSKATGLCATISIMLFRKMIDADQES